MSVGKSFVGETVSSSSDGGSLLVSVVDGRLLTFFAVAWRRERTRDGVTVAEAVTQTGVFYARG